ncbi:MAG: hypothetical protein U0P45_13480 [Acidimicrobiales bacterium]
MHTSLDQPVRRHRLSPVVRIAALVAVPLMLLTSCKLSDVTDPVVKPIEDLFGLGSDEIATPKFEITNGITIQVVVKISDLTKSIPVTVHLRCSGGTELTDTITIRTSGSISVGEATFTPGWPAGTDCLVSQDIVQGVDTVDSALKWLTGNDLQATFQNA